VPLRIGLAYDLFGSYPLRPGDPPDAEVEYEPEATVLVLEAALRRLGHEPVRLPTVGGSIPMYLFQQPNDTPVIGLPIANHDDNQHSSDENRRLQNLWDGIEIYAALFAGLGAGPQ